MIITVDLLKKIAPDSRKTKYQLLPGLAEWMNYWFPKYSIGAKGELCHFLAQAAHETDSFNSLKEYASGAAYDTRVDLGNTPQRDGDGQRLKGRGIMMITGAFNYQKATLEWNEKFPSDRQDFFINPELLEQPKYAVWSACEYWDTRTLNVIANMPDSKLILAKSIKKKLPPLDYITWRVNGGFYGLKERRTFYERAKTLIMV